MVLPKQAEEDPIKPSWRRFVVISASQFWELDDEIALESSVADVFCHLDEDLVDGCYLKVEVLQI